MKNWFIIFLILITGSAWAQVESIDSLFSKAPNIDNLLQTPKDKIDSIQARFNHRTDSLKNIYHANLSKLDAIGAYLQRKEDSLKSLKLPTEKYTHKLDSINQLRQQAVNKLDQKIVSLKTQTTDKLKSLNFPPELKSKVSEVTKSIDGFKLPGSVINIPSLNLPDNPLRDLNGLPNVQSSLSDVGKIDGLKNVQENIGDLSKVTGQVSGYQQDLQQITQGNLNNVQQLPETMETKAVEMTGANVIQDQTKVLDQYKGLAGQAQNPEALKEQVQQIAIDHFAGKEKELQAAMDKVSKYKQKYSSVNSLSEITKRPPNPMKGKPLIERLRPGIAFQLQKKGEDLLVDFNPYVGYRFSGRLTSGMGWNQRVAYNTKDNYFHHEATVYGPRAYGEMKIWKGFIGRAEVEVMNTLVPPIVHSSNTDPFGREWVWGAMAGMKKEYRITKRIRGTALIMYNVYDPHHKSPYADRINARFGFEFLHGSFR